MTDINLKTLTPDTSLPTTGFLFGADSQASTNPSVYSTQTVATTLLGSTSLTGDVLTASAPVLNLTQQWNSVGTTFTGLKFNVDTTTYNQSAAASLLMDLQVGGVSQAIINKGGSLLSRGLYTSSYGIELFSTAANAMGRTLTDRRASFSNDWPGLGLSANYLIQWASVTSGDIAGNFDLFLTRKGTRNLQLGQADAATALAQTLSVQSVVAGTSNTAGAAFTINGSQGTGTGAGGSIVFQVAPAGGSGTAQNALAAALTIASTGNAFFSNYVYVGALNNHGIGSAGSNRLNLVVNGQSVVEIHDTGFGALGSGLSMRLGAYLGFQTATGSHNDPDTLLTRVAAGIVKVTGTSATGPGVIVTTPTIVASLPAAATAGAGAFAFVTDATMTMTLGIGTAVVGGGANKVPVYSDGASWLIG